MRKRALVLATVLVAAFAAMTGAANAKTIKASSSFLSDNGTCGGNNGGAVVGKAKFERLGNTVAITSFTTKHLLPFEFYEIELWGSSPCHEIVDYGGFDTNKKGVFKYKESLSTTVGEGETEFFATLLGGGFYNDTTTVTLP